MMSNFYNIKFFVLCLFLKHTFGWSRDLDANESTGKLKDLDVICGKDHMTVRAEFDGQFNGIVSSKGSWGQGNCVYIKSHSGVTHATFKVMYNECGTKPDLQGKYYENTIVIQYGTDIIEAMDEAKRLRCEWFEAYEKPATFRPAIPVADLDVVEMNFQGDDIDCWMEIQEGKGPWSRQVNRIVPVGQPMTIVIAISDQSNQFDMRVKSCFAHDGVKPPVQLTDEYGCVLRKSMLSEFGKIRGSDYRKGLDSSIALNDYLSKATVISFAHFYAFKFPDSMSVQMQCTVEVCRHGCPNACERGYYPPPAHVLQPKISFNQASSNSNQKLSNQNHNHVNDLVLDDDTVLTAAESNIQSSFDKQPKIENHRLYHENEPFNKISTLDKIENQITNLSQIANTIFSNSVDTNKQFSSTEDTLQHESSKLVKELNLSGLDLDHLRNSFLTLTQPLQLKTNNNNVNNSNSNLDTNILNNLVPNVQRVQNDHLEKVFQNEALRELALASGIKLNNLNEYLPQAQPLIHNENNALNKEKLNVSFNSSPNMSKTNSNNSLEKGTTSSSLEDETTEDVHLVNEINKISNLNQDKNDTKLNDLINYKQSENLNLLNNLNLPKFDMPSINMPNINMPSINMPNINIPNINMPNINIPNINLNENSIKKYNINEHNINENNINEHNINKHNINVYNTLLEEEKRFKVENQVNLNINFKNDSLSTQLNNINQNKPQLNLLNKHPIHLSDRQQNYPQFVQPIKENLPLVMNTFYPNKLDIRLKHPQNIYQPFEKIYQHQYQNRQPNHHDYILNTIANQNVNSLPSIQLHQLNTLVNQPSINLPSSTIKPLSKFANLLKHNSFAQYGYSLLQSFQKPSLINSKKSSSNLAPGLLSNLFDTKSRNLNSKHSIFPAGPRSFRLARSVHYTKQSLNLNEKNNLSLVKRTRRSIGSQVYLQQQFQVVTPMDMEFNEDLLNLAQPDLLQGHNLNKNLINKSLICIQFKSYLLLTLSVSIIFLFILILISLYIWRTNKTKTLE